MKLGSSQAEHSLIGMVWSCALMARIAVIESVPGTRPKRMICGLAASMASTCGVTSVAPTWSIWVETSWKPFCLGEGLHGALVGQADRPAVVLEQCDPGVVPGHDQVLHRGDLVLGEDVVEAGEAPGVQLARRVAVGLPAGGEADQDRLVGDRDRQRGLRVRTGLWSDDELRVVGLDALARVELGVGGVRLVVERDVLDLVAEDAAGGVDVLEVRLRAPVVGLADLRVRAGQGLVAADDDGGVAAGGIPAATASCRRRARRPPGPRPRPRPA